MCFSAPKVKVPEKPQVIKREDATVQAEEEARKRLRGRRGRAGTILTSALGDPSFGQNVAQTTLGGQAQ